MSGLRSGGDRNDIRIFLDLDGVLADFVQGAVELHGYDSDPYGPVANRGRWDLEKIIGIPEQDFFSPMGYDFWANLKPLPWAWQLMDIVNETFGEENVAIMTSPVPRDGCIDGKRAWIKKHLPNIGTRVFFGKHKWLCANPHALLIDDYPKNVNRFRRNGGQGLLFPAKWNKLHWISDPLAYTIGYIQRLKEERVC